MRLLVVGSTIEAVLAIHALLKCEAVEHIFHLPTDSGGGYSVFSKRAPCPEGLCKESRTLERCTVRDRWGKKVFSLKLDGFAVHRVNLEAPVDPKLEGLAQGVELSRTRACEGTLEIGLSDGTDLLCDGVMFADGPKSRGLVLAKQRDLQVDRSAVGCWSFERDDLLSLNDWEYRWAVGKTVEQLPLPGGRVRVGLRFRSKHGSKLTPEELKDLFAEFGADMEALFEDVTADQIEYREERAAPSEFQPLAGCLALGEAAVGVRNLDGFDWRQRLVEGQLKAVLKQCEQGTWKAKELATQSQQIAEPLLGSEAFFRGGMHYDNVLLRPIRDLILSFLPDAFTTGKLKARLSL